LCVRFVAVQVFQALVSFVPRFQQRSLTRALASGMFLCLQPAVVVVTLQ
jgi:hypothetical protein